MKISIFSWISNLTFVISISLSLSTLKAQDPGQTYTAVKSPAPEIPDTRYQVQIPYTLIGQQQPTLLPNQKTLSAIASTFTVTNTNDTGNGSLRKAIEDANLSVGTDIIQFAVGTGLQTIKPASPLPNITEAVLMDGTTQPGYTDKPVIEIEGSLSLVTSGLIISANGCTIKGISITRFDQAGIALLGANTTIEGCFIGISPDGATGKGNGWGIVVYSANNNIGNPDGRRNVVSSNTKTGIQLQGVDASRNRILNNYVGTNSDGTAAVPNNGPGIYLLQSSQDTIGGLGFDGMNVISGNLDAGILIQGGLAQKIVIQNNRIGTSANGGNAIGNKSGIMIMYGLPAEAGCPSDILIGGTWSDGRNLISGNLQTGVAFFFDALGGAGNIVAGNDIGTDATGTKKLANGTGIYINRNDNTGNKPGVKIGGTINDSSNLISGNKNEGITIGGAGAWHNRVLGNYIGTTRRDINGTTLALGNGSTGVIINNTSYNTIGDIDIMHGNVIGSNNGNGISIGGSIAIGNTIYNNFIGTDQNQMFNLGNIYQGIYIEGSGTKVGGPDLTNVIAYNKYDGILMYYGNNNRMYGNSIYKNGLMGIDLKPEKITPNDKDDIDDGPNFLQNFPILDSALLKTDSVIIYGRFNSKPLTSYTLHFYKNNQRSPSHFGEGEIYLDSLVVNTNDSGFVNVKARFKKTVSETQYITALAVDSTGNTSEFSRALCLQDSDGDGIFDCWESQGDGIDVNADGIIDYDLWAKGARPNHKDIFVEVDYMAGFKPMDTKFKKVTAAFNEVPNKYLNNPDGEDGIHLVAELDTTSVPLFHEILPDKPWPRFFTIKKLFFGTDAEYSSLNSKNILDAKRLVYRYCIWGDQFKDITGTETSPSGLAELTDGAGGNDFLITLGGFDFVGGKEDQQAGTFMHELGHTLGLYHGGLDDINYKPNYFSVMNYTWQFPNYDGSEFDLTWKLTYSPAAMPSLDENHLDELKGLEPPPSDYPDPIFFPYSMNISNTQRTGIIFPDKAVDWNGNRDSTSTTDLKIDINNLDSPRDPLSYTKLVGHADWPNLKYNFRKSPNFKDPVPGLKQYNTYTEPEEMTPEIYEYLQSLPPYGVVRPIQVPSSILWLGTLGGEDSHANGISDDGMVVTGYAEDSAYDIKAFRWTPATGMQNLGTLGGNESEANAISADGNTIVGVSTDSNNVERAFVWTAETGMKDMGAGDYSEATAVSGNGKAITVNINQRAYLWTSSGMTDLGNLGSLGTSAAAISDDGLTIAGYSSFGGNPYAFRSTASGMERIGSYYSFANGISGNGKTVIGSETGMVGRHRAFWWRGGDPPQYLTNIVGDFSQGSDASYDGKYIVGDGANGAFRLSKTGVLEYFNETCADILIPGTYMYSATAISGDGRYVTGYGHKGGTDYNTEEAYLLDTGGTLPGLFASVNEREKPVNASLTLEQNFPNPFNSSTTIRYNLPASSRVNITVYNFTGQPVKTLVNTVKAAGKHEVKFNGSLLAPGIYLYRLQAGSHVVTKKMIMIK